MSNRLWDKTPRTLYVTTDHPDICTMWRVWWPALELAARGYVADYCSFGELNQFEPAIRYGRYNTVVTPRMAFATEEAEAVWLKFINEIRPAVQWWYDCDDDLWTPGFVDRQMATHTFEDPDSVRKEMEDLRASRIRLLQKVDGVTAASYPLLDLSCELSNKLTAFVPNGINERAYIDRSVVMPKDRPLIVGWSGGPRLEEDIEPLYEVWPKLAKLRPDVHFVLQGWLPSKLVSLMPAGRLHTKGGVPAEQYPRILRSIDIFCCVTGDDPWNTFKTPIKWYEATLAGAACVVSHDLYGPIVAQDQAALIAKTPDEWLAALLELVDDAELRRSVQATAYETVLKKHTLKQTYNDWLDAWSMQL